MLTSLEQRVLLERSSSHVWVGLERPGLGRGSEVKKWTWDLDG